MRYAPLTLTTLAALVPKDVPTELTLWDEGIEEIPDDLGADLVGISAITGTAPRSYEIADALRQRGTPGVLGGVHPTLKPDEAQLHADAVVTGYAEDTWSEDAARMSGPHSTDGRIRGRARPRRVRV